MLNLNFDRNFDKPVNFDIFQILDILKPMMNFTNEAEISFVEDDDSLNQLNFS